jgi:hypothetical protein
MPVMFMLLQKWTFDGKFKICQISLLPTDSVIFDHTVCIDKALQGTTGQLLSTQSIKICEQQYELSLTFTYFDSWVLPWQHLVYFTSVPCDFRSFLIAVELK